MAEENNAVVKVPVVTLDNYPGLAGRTEKVPTDVVTLSPLDKGVLERGLCHAHRLGELLDQIKRHVIYGKIDAGIASKVEVFERGVSSAWTWHLPDTIGIEHYRLLHASIGMFTEAGEFLDSVIKSMQSQSPMDKVNVLEELGDQSWYQAIPMNILGISHQEVLQKNIDKLAKRYGAKYSDLAAIERDTAAEREVLEIAHGRTAALVWVDSNPDGGPVKVNFNVSSLVVDYDRAISAALADSETPEVDRTLVTFAWRAHAQRNPEATPKEFVRNLIPRDEDYEELQVDLVVAALNLRK